MLFSSLDETKFILKSLVVSCPHEMTIDKLDRDFKTTEGYWIPYKHYGFPNLNTFLLSLNDTLVIKGHGKFATVGFVTNEKSKHIDEMVSGQKNASYQRRSASCKPSQMLQRELRNTSHNLSQTTSKLANDDTFREYESFELIKETKKYETDHDISRLSTNTTKDGKIVNEDNSTLKTEKLSCQKNTYRIRPQSCIPPQMLQRELEKTSYNLSQSTDKLDGKIVNEDNSALKTEMLSCQKNTYRIRPQSCIPPQTLQRELEKTSYNLSQSTDKLAHKDRFKYVKSFELIKGGVKNGKEHDISRLSSNISNNCKITNEDNQTLKMKMVQQSDLNLPSTSNKGLHEQKNYISFKLKPKTKLLEKNTNAFWTNDTNAQTCKPSLIEEKPQTNCVFLHNYDENSNTKIDINEAVPDFAANSTVFRVDFPENTAVFGVKIEPYELPDDFKKGLVIGIFITDVHTPFKFWFHLHKEEHEVDFLMNRIENFYTNLNEDEYLIPISCITPGQVCAALFSNFWHRGEILTPAINNEAKIFFLDYGTVSKISINNIKYLASKFVNLPAQALRGSLSHIKPKKLHWENEATDKFLSLSSKCLLYAQITEIDVESRSTYMILCDTNCDETIQINKCLVTTKNALYDYEWEEDKICKAGHRQHHPREDFPTFEMLENGEYPSLYELRHLLLEGIDYEAITDKKVFHPGKVVSCNKLLGKDLSFPLLSTNPFKCDIVNELCQAMRC